MEKTGMMKLYEETTYLDDDPQALIQIIEYLKECIQGYKAKADAYDKVMSGGKVWEEGIMKTQESLKSYSLSNYPCLFDKFKVLLMHLYEEGYKKDDLISCVNTTYKGLEEEFGLTFPDRWEN